MKEYIPIGTCIAEVRRFSTYGDAALALEAMKDKHPSAFIDTCAVHSNHTNRDGQYSENNYVVFVIKAEFPTYSRDDTMSMTLDRLAVSAEKHGIELRNGWNKLMYNTRLKSSKGM